jgi:hypothetical protein
VCGDVYGREDEQARRAYRRYAAYGSWILGRGMDCEGMGEEGMEVLHGPTYRSGCCNLWDWGWRCKCFRGATRKRRRLMLVTVLHPPERGGDDRTSHEVSARVR